VEKLPQLWGLRSQNPVGLRQLGALSPDSQVNPTRFTGDFGPLHKFFDIDQIKIATYFVLDWQLVGPFVKFAPLAQTSSYATT